MTKGNEVAGHIDNHADILYKHRKVLRNCSRNFVTVPLKILNDVKTISQIESRILEIKGCMAIAEKR